MEADPCATSSQISWTLAAFLIIQGCYIIERHSLRSIWSASALFVAENVTVALSKPIKVMIGMRALQAAGPISTILMSEPVSTIP
ncbi:uncharacterized protein HD556DRAFT_1026722 [Suillus plorans]|uniref:Uncharacterized protein n=1 Tax=Suillus plorans TaxID=116603 RepID=A0A9P7J397_9AGAM|nr:uncharacterized protein HD556DRAFT_1026722 [Suillus plorans]KAG1800318.1 hypothetical protein HD556DRAFT_1026722 [Suillus plorans]